MDLRGVQRETDAEKVVRLASLKRYEEDRSEKRFRSRGGASEDVELANICRELGIDFFQHKLDELFGVIPSKCEGRKVSGFSSKALEFLGKYYDTEQVVGPGGKLLLHFTKGKETKMSILTDIQKRTGQPRKLVKEFYAALIRQVHRDLREKRKARLPELGLIQVKYREARKGGKKPNPFKKGEMMKVKPRDASNKLKFRISRDLATYVEEKVAVEEPKKKK